MKICIVSEYIQAHQNSTGNIWAKVIGGLARDFDGVSVIAPKTERQPQEIFGVEVEMDAVAVPEFDKNRLLSRIWGQICMSLGFLAVLRRKIRAGDIVLSGTNPAPLLILLAMMKRYAGFRWILLVHDVFPENLVPAGIVSRSGLLFRLLSPIFSWVYSSAERLIVIGRDMEELMLSKTGDQSRIVFIPNWASEHEVFPLTSDRATLVGREDWTNKIVFQFFGNIGRVQGIENLLRAIDKVTHPQAAFVFIGDGAVSHKIRQFIAAHPSRDMMYVGSVPMARKNLALAACDVALVTLEKGMLGLGVPSKAYFSMAAGKPILAVMERNAEVSRMVLEEGIGWQCEPDQPEALAALIDDLCRQGANLHSADPREVLIAKYSEAAALRKFSQCVDGLVHRA